MPTFSLVDQAWLPCERLDGTFVPMSLADTLGKSESIRRLTDPSPLVTAALHRFLLAILHRNFGPASADAWGVLWRRGRWDQEALTRYLTKFRDRFDLFDEVQPFYQARNLDFHRAGPITDLVREAASGNNATLFRSFTRRRAKCLISSGRGALLDCPPGFRPWWVGCIRTRSGPKGRRVRGCGPAG